MNTALSVVNPWQFRDDRFISSCKSADAPPTLDVLRYFPVKDGHIDIAAEIPPDYGNSEHCSWRTRLEMK